MKQNNEERDIIMLDDVSPILTQPLKKKKMKRTSKYYKRKKDRFQFIKEYNNFFILPTIRIYYDTYNDKFDKLLLEFSWFKLTFAIRFI
jgi:hypothetical protein